MIQSRNPNGSGGLHVALIMDGNGRWAAARGLPRSAGHRAGAEAARAIIRGAPELGISTLTLFGFSAANWHRPASEVSALMSLFRKYLEGETAACAANGVRMSVIGRRERLSPRLVNAIAAAEDGTRGGRRLHLRLAVDYSAREAIVRAARLSWDGSAGGFEQALARAQHADSAPPVDLLLRTGGEQRLSDFLLWECAYAEFLFLKKMWPEFRVSDLEAALAEFRTRDRRFGRVKTGRTLTHAESCSTHLYKRHPERSEIRLAERAQSKDPYPVQAVMPRKGIPTRAFPRRRENALAQHRRSSLLGVLRLGARALAPRSE